MAITCPTNLLIAASPHLPLPSRCALLIRPFPEWTLTVTVWASLHNQTRNKTIEKYFGVMLTVSVRTRTGRILWNPCAERVSAGGLLVLLVLLKASPMSSRDQMGNKTIGKYFGVILMVAVRTSMHTQRRLPLKSPCVFLYFPGTSPIKLSHPLCQYVRY